MAARRAPIIYLVIAIGAVGLLAYHLTASGRAPSDAIVPLSALIIILAIPFLAARRHIRQQEAVPDRHAVRQQALIKAAVVLVAAPLLAGLVFYGLYPAPIALPVALVVFLAANAMFVARL